MLANFNWYGCYYLSQREIRRFFKVYHQSLIAPSISAILFMMVLSLSVGGEKKEIHGIAFNNFIAYGLIIMTIIQNAFANSSSSLTMSKVIGYISDILIPPLDAKEILLAYITGAVARGVICGIILSLLLSFWIEYSLYSLYYLVFFTLMGSILMGIFGIFAGIFASSFDQGAAINSYLITPMSFLSGTFYSADKLPLYLQKINYCNPFFHIINGFRFSLTGYTDTNIIYSSIFLLIFNIATAAGLYKLIESGWRIKE